MDAPRPMFLNGLIRLVCLPLECILLMYSNIAITFKVLGSFCFSPSFVASKFNPSQTPEYYYSPLFTTSEIFIALKLINPFDFPFIYCTNTLTDYSLQSPSGNAKENSTNERPSLRAQHIIMCLNVTGS